MSGRNRLGAQIRAWKVAAAIGAAVVIGGPAWAQDEVKVPTDPVAKAAFEVLDKHCARCHQVGKLTARERPSKNFGNVLQMEELAESPGMIVPGNPYASKLFKEIVNGEMPYDIAYEGSTLPKPSEAELKALETWISSLGGTRKIAIEAAPAPGPQAAAPPPGPPPAPVAEPAGPPPGAPPAPVAEPAGPPPGAPPAPVAEPAGPPPGAPPAPVAEPAGPPPGPGPGPAPVKVVGGECKFFGRKEMVSAMAADLDTLPKSRAKSTRYLYLTHLTNLCKPDKFMDVYRQATVKLLNSLSRSSEVIVLNETFLDPKLDYSRSIMRINLDDLGWDDKDWETLVANYPYATKPDTKQYSILEESTGTKTVMVRADWFAFVASRPGMYEKLLKLPKTWQALAKEHGVDVDANIKKFIAQRAGFQKSGVSKHNRLIERHPSKFGYFWTSYDFAGSGKKQSLYDFPLGPGGAKGFDHDGGETIFSLPNGFQAYYLNEKDGKALEKGPTNIVQDFDNPRDPAVTNGISCMRCHDQGMRFKLDDVRPTVLKGKVLSREDRETVEALYPPDEKMKQFQVNDQIRFLEAMKRAGLDPKLKLNGVEMIFALSQSYENDVDADQAASELGLKKKDMLEAAGDVDAEQKILFRRLAQGTIPRDAFEGVYIDVAQKLGDELPIRKGGGGVKKAEVNEKDLVLVSDKDTYQVGDTPVFTVKAPNDCFLTVTSVDEKGFGVVLFPNEFAKDNKVKGKTEIALGSEKLKFRFRMKDPGTETISAVCTEAKVEVDGIKQVTSKAKPVVEVPNYTSSVARGLQTAPKKRAIEVIAPAEADGVKGGKVKVPDPKAPKEFRTAIKVGVKDK